MSQVLIFAKRSTKTTPKQIKACRNWLASIPKQDPNNIYTTEFDLEPKDNTEHIIRQQAIKVKGYDYLIYLDADKL